MNRRSFLRTSAFLAAAAGAARRAQAGWPSPRHVIELSGLRVTLHKPRLVAQSINGACHFGSLKQFSTGEIWLTANLNSDSETNDRASERVWVSTNGGTSFPAQPDFDVEGFWLGGGEPFISLPDGRLVGISNNLRPDPSDPHRYFATYREFGHGGKRQTVEPWSAVIEGIPRAVQPYRDKRAFYWWADIYAYGDIIPLANGSWLCVVHCMFEGDGRLCALAIVSDNQGRSWRYLSTVAGPDAASDAPLGEGPDESSITRLADGRLMFVARVGNNLPLVRSYSSDEGSSWSAPDRLPAASVAPKLCTLDNQVVALTVGRPGINLWLAADAGATSWQSIDLLQHHNAFFAPALSGALSELEARPLRRPPSDQAIPGFKGVWQTTNYTDMIQVSPNRLMITYDEGPYARKFVVDVSVERAA